MSVDFKKIGQKEWDKFPEPQVQKPPNRWEEVLGLLEAGEIVEIPVPADKLKGTRIGLARSASTRGYKLEFRYLDGRLAVRRSDEPLAVKEPKERKPRSRKGSEETAETTA